MKRSMFCLLTNCVASCAIAWLAGTVIAQPFNYRVELVDFHFGSTGGRSEDIAMVDDGSGERLFVVGFSTFSNGEKRAFVYDRRNNDFIDVPTLLGLDENTWLGSSCTAINSNGVVVGWVKDTSANLHGFWFDILTINPGLNLLEVSFPEIVDGSSNHAVDVNANGEVLTSNGRVVNITNGNSLQLPAEILTSGVTSKSAINDLGIVIGFRQGVGGPIRYNIHTNQVDYVPGSDSSFIFFDLNSFGEFCGYADVVYTIRRNQTRTRQQAYRWGVGPDFDWLSDPALPTGVTDFITAESLNDSGDVVGQVSEDHPSLVFFYDAFFLYSESDSIGNEVGTTYLIKDLVNDPYLNTASLWGMDVTERDSSLGTPAPTIVGNAASGSDKKMFILIPEEMPPTVTFNSTDTPKSIPDNNATGVTSTIAVAENVTITNLSVALNISHPRMSDLQATLIGPNNVSVPLASLTGANDVNNFDGGNSQGNWRVKVVDSVKKQSGTLNGWSLTIEY